MERSDGLGECDHGMECRRHDGDLPAASARLGDLLQATEVAELFDAYSRLVRIPVAIVDVHANTIFFSPRQRICSRIHHPGPAACICCTGCAIQHELTSGMGREPALHAGPDGLTDGIAPIVLDGRHVANVILGHFLTRAPDEERWRRQAAESGLDADDIVAALRDVPVLDAAGVPEIVGLLGRMALVIARLAIERSAGSSEERFRLAFMTSSDVYYWATLDEGRIIEVNPVFQDVFGHTRDEVIGRTSLELGLFADPSDRTRIVAEVRAKGAVRNVEMNLRRKDGSIVPTLLTISRLEVVGEEHILGIVRDVSDQKRAERELKQHQLDLEKLVAQRTQALELLNRLTLVSLESAAVGAWWVSFDEQDTYHALDTLARLIGVPVSRSPDRAYRISDWVTVLMETRRRVPEYAGIIDATIDRFEGTRSGKYDRYAVVYPVAVPGVGIRWIDARADVSARGSDGRALGMTGTVIDVTELVEARKDLEVQQARLEAQVAQRTEQLAQSNRHLREVSERLALATRAASIGVWDWDVANDELVWDESMHAIYGTGRESFGGASAAWSRALHPEDRVTMERATLDALSGVRDFACEFRVVRPDGSVRHVQGAAVTFRGPDGVPTRMVGVNIDVTERKEAERRRVDLEEQLRASQKLEAIGSLAGGVAHDFNNLLSVILGYTEFAIRAAPERSPQREHLLEVYGAGERAAALTRQLLAFSRKQVLQPVVLDLNEVVAGIEKMLRRVVGEDVEIGYLCACDLGRVMADPGQIEQVLMNLVINARDAMPSGGRLTIETSNVVFDAADPGRPTFATPGPWVRLTVTDTGCGMDERTRARIFEPFFTTKPKGKGTGLGLSTVYGIVKQSGGDVCVRSEPERGSTFEIYLPRDVSGAACAAGIPRPSPAAVAGSETILVVEDEPALRGVAESILVAAGYTVLTAADGADAIRLCERHAGEIHVLLTDVIMPGINGSVLADTLLGTRPGLRVVYMSGYTDSVIVDHSVLETGTHFLPKPFTVAGLTRKVREAVDGRRADPGRS